MNGQAYLGDGAYALYDGYGIWIYCDVDGRRHSVFLEPEGLARLENFVDSIKAGTVAPADWTPR